MRTLRPVQRYSLAALVVLATLVVRTLMEPLWETTAPFALFMFATVLAAWFLGPGPALLTGTAGLLTRLYFDSPRGTTVVITWEEAVRLALFAGFVVATAVILSRMRADRRELEASIERARSEIGQRRQVEAALRKSEQRWQQLADAMPQIVWSGSHDGIDYFNRRWTEYTGLAPADSRTLPAWQRVVHPEDLPVALGAWTNSLATGDTYEVEYRLREAATGQWRWFLARALPVRNAEGSLDRWFGTCTDIDAQKRAEQAMEAARNAAEEANRMKDEFLAMVSHELRTPLNAVLGWVSLIRSGTLPPARIPSALEVVDRNARLQAQLVTDLLDVARTLTGRLEIDPAQRDLVEIARSETATSQPAAEARQIALTFTAQAAPLYVWADGDRIRQVIRNLLSNAIKFTPPAGRVDVDLRARDGNAELTVIDTGAGIDPQFLPHLFHPFTQAETGATRRYGGLGLGLAIVRHIIELHGGWVGADSSGQGLGSRFTVLLPLRIASGNPADSALAQEPVSVRVPPGPETERSMASSK